MLRTSQKEFPIVDGAGRPRGLLTRDGFIPALRQGGPQTLVLEVMTREVPTVRDWQPSSRPWPNSTGPGPPRSWC